MAVRTKSHSSNGVRSSANASKKHEQTRARLLQAAEKIFARDGFEAAKLEEIAAAAGYTRGAFYANFDSKESLFLAMLEEKIRRRIERMRDASDRFEDPLKKLGAMRDFFAETAKDCEWTLIGLEFKLFALRHRELRPQVVAMRRRIFAAATSVLDAQLRAAKVKLPVSAIAFVISLGALTHGLELDRMLDKAITEDEIQKICRLYFDCIVQPKSS